MGVAYFYVDVCVVQKNRSKLVTSYLATQKVAVVSVTPEARTARVGRGTEVFLKIGGGIMF